jgi:hypothetical protein
MSLPTEKLYTWQRGTDVPFRTRVSMGKVVDARPVFVFGFNPDVQNVEETVWDHGGVYAYPASAIPMTISSSNAGTNAVVSIVGLGAGYVEQTELITLNGQTPVTTANSYLRINGMSALTGTVADSIYLGTGTVTSGVPATVYARIINGNNRTEAGHLHRACRLRILFRSWHHVARVGQLKRFHHGAPDVSAVRVAVPDWRQGYAEQHLHPLPLCLSAAAACRHRH